MRLRHLGWAAQRARAEIVEGDELHTYRLEYPEIGRALEIRFRAAFPHEIEGWEETVVSGRGADARTLTTRATQKKRLMIDYWNHNSLGDRGLRDRLGLD